MATSLLCSHILDTYEELSEPIVHHESRAVGVIRCIRCSEGAEAILLILDCILLLQDIEGAVKYTFADASGRGLQP